jgi:ABC-type polysaccharide/polyol phosphate export permease
MLSSVFINFFKQIYYYREFLFQSVARDLKNKYKRSFLGYVWTMLHPLAMMGILAVVFSNIMKLENYAVFLFTGLIPWNYFQSTSLMSMHSIRSNARLFSQVPIPKFMFVISIVCSNLANLLFAILPLFILMLASGKGIPWTALLFPIALIPLILLTTALSLVLASSNVFFDDTSHLAEVALQGLYFLSPILYMRSSLPASLSQYLALNPIAFAIESFRGLFYSGTLPDMPSFCIYLAFSIVCLWAAVLIFKRVENKFLYYV